MSTEENDVRIGQRSCTSEVGTGLLHDLNVADGNVGDPTVVVILVLISDPQNLFARPDVNKMD